MNVGFGLVIRLVWLVWLVLVAGVLLVAGWGGWVRWLCLFGFGVVMVACGRLVGLWCVLFVTGRCSLFGAAYRGLRAYVWLVVICWIFLGCGFSVCVVDLVWWCAWWLCGSGLGVLGFWLPGFCFER